MRHQATLLVVAILAVFVLGCVEDDERPTTPVQVVSAAIVTPGNPAAVPQYEMVELLAVLENGYVSNPYDPDPARGGCDLSATFTAPGGATWTVNGFYDGSSWRIRFAPDTLGAWTYTVTATDTTGTHTWTGGAFTCVAGTNKGWLRINGQYLQNMAGETVVPVGHNNGWQYDVEVPTFASMASRGENLLSFWLTVPWADPTDASETYWDDRAAIDPLQNGIGTYNQAACRYIDGVVSRAEASGIYLLPTLWSHGQLRDTGHAWGTGWWDNNVYNTICSATDFFKTTEAAADTDQWRHQKNLYRYILARWGHSTAIAGWVFLCEVEGTTGWVANPTQLENWCGSVRQYFVSNDKYRLSGSGAYPGVATKTDWSGDAGTWNVGMNMRAQDSYTQQSSDTAIATAVGNQTRTMWSSGLPVFHTEFGGKTDAGATQPTHLHNGLWPGIAAGACMTPLVWCDGGSWPLLTAAPAMRDHLEYLSQFTSPITTWTSYTSQTSATYSSGTATGWGIRASNAGILWSFDTAGVMNGVTITVTGLDTGQYQVSWYNPNASCNTAALVQSINVPGSDLVLTAPNLGVNDVACRFLRTGAILSPAPAAADCP